MAETITMVEDVTRLKSGNLKVETPEGNFYVSKKKKIRLEPGNIYKLIHSTFEGNDGNSEWIGAAYPKGGGGEREAGPKKESYPSKSTSKDQASMKMSTEKSVSMERMSAMKGAVSLAVVLGEFLINRGELTVDQFIQRMNMERQAWFEQILLELKGLPANKKIKEDYDASEEVLDGEVEGEDVPF